MSDVAGFYAEISALKARISELEAKLEGGEPDDSEDVANTGTPASFEVDLLGNDKDVGGDDDETEGLGA